MAATQHKPPDAGFPQPVWVLYAKPNHQVEWREFTPKGSMRWGYDEWGNGPEWFVDAEPWEFRLAGVRDVQSRKPEGAG